MLSRSLGYDFEIRPPEWVIFIKYGERGLNSTRIEHFKTKWNTKLNFDPPMLFILNGYSTICQGQSLVVSGDQKSLCSSHGQTFSPAYNKYMF